MKLLQVVRSAALAALAVYGLMAFGGVRASAQAGSHTFQSSGYNNGYSSAGVNGLGSITFGYNGVNCYVAPGGVNIVANKANIGMYWEAVDTSGDGGEIDYYTTYGVPPTGYLMSVYVTPGQLNALISSYTCGTTPISSYGTSGYASEAFQPWGTGNGYMWGGPGNPERDTTLNVTLQWATGLYNWAMAEQATYLDSQVGCVQLYIEPNFFGQYMANGTWGSNEYGSPIGGGIIITTSQYR